jgi:general secretion pathway protein I
MKCRCRDSGFTLIETVVAFTIAATALGLLYKIHANGAATAVLAGEYLAATELAESLVTELPITEPSIGFARSGVTSEKYRWAVHSEALSGENTALDERTARYQLRNVSVEVEWRSRDKERRIDLHTVKPFFPERTP